MSKKSRTAHTFLQQFSESVRSVIKVSKNNFNYSSAKKISKKISRKIIVGVGALVVGLVLFGGYLFFAQPEKVAAWFDYNWAYRVVYILTNSGSAINAERKIKFDVDTAALISAGKIQADCDDARFTDQDGKVLEYFIDTTAGACNTSSTDFYVKVPSVPSNKLNIYFYYGNPTASQGRSPDFFAKDTTGQGLIAYYKMDETAANTCTGGSNDSCDSAYTTDGAWNGNTAYTASGKINGATTHDGTGDYISIADSSNTRFDSGTQDFTISAYIRTAVNNKPIIDKRDGSNDGYILYLDTSGYAKFLLDGKTITGATNIADDVWHHVSVVIDRDGNGVLYVDGSSNGSPTAITSEAMATTANLMIAANSFGTPDYFTGSIDDVRLYNRALSASEITAIYNAGNSTAIATPLTFTPSASTAQSEEKTPGPIGSWKMDESSGATVYDTTQQAHHGAFLTGVPISTGLSQQVELLSKNFTTTSTTYAPTDNSLGLTYYDSSKYTSPSVFFEAVVKQRQTNTTSNDVGRATAIDCPTNDDCKIVYYDFDTSSIRFMDCDDVTCSTGTITILDGYTSCTTTGCDTTVDSGEQLSMYCITASDCKVAYYSGTNADVFFIDCDSATCSSGTRTLLDGNTGCTLSTCTNRVVGQYVEVDCVAGSDDCKLAYFSSGGDTFFADCDNATCSSGTTRMVDGGSSCPLTGCNASIGTVGYLDLMCLSATDCKMSYFNDTNDDLMFIDCDNATCTSGTSSAIDGISGCPLTGCSTTDAVGYNTSIYCVATDDCKVGYYNSTDADLYFADCNNATCTSGTTTLIEGGVSCALTSCLTSGSSGGYISVYCGGGSDDCKIGFFRTTTDDLRFADCSNSACTSGSIVTVDGGSGCGLTSCSTSTQAGNFLTMHCFSATDCKIVHNEAANDDVYFADCDNAGCSTGTARILDGNGAKESDVGSFMDMDCSAGADNCKIAYYDATETALAFFDCDDVNCTTGTLVYLDGVVNCALTGCSTSADAGSHVKIDCSAGGNDCKIAYNNLTSADMYFADCDSQTCNVGSRQLIDGNTGCSLTGCVNSGIGLYTDLDCSTGASDCKIVYKNSTTDDLIFADCDTATCSSGTRTMLDGNTGCALTGCSTSNNSGSYPSLDCPTATDCKIAYHETTATALKFADCDTATCSSGTISIVDGTTGCGVTGCATANNSGQFASLDCSAGATDCKIAHYNQTGADLFFVDCDNATCSSGATNLVDGSVGCPLTGCSTSVLAHYPSLYCGGNSTDCKIGYFRTYDLGFADCDSTSCNTGTVTTIDAGAGCTLTGCSTIRTYDAMFSLDCSSGAADCKVAGYESTTLDVNFANCDDATCSTGSVNVADNGGDRTWVQLMSSAGAPVPDAIISSKTTDYTRFRTAAISPTTATNYGIRVASSDTTNITADLSASRLIINQSGSPTATETHVEVGNNETSTATSYTQLTNKKIYHFDTNKFTPTPTIYFEATLANTTGGQTAYAALYTDGASCSSVVSGSEVTVTGTTWARVRSSAITLSDDADYMVCIKTSANTAQIANARIVLDQSSTIYSTELVYNLINTLHTDADSTYTAQSGLNYFDPSYFSDSTTYYYESDVKTSAGTGYSQLYNSSDAAAVSSSEVSTTGSSYSRQRSAALTMPVTAKVLDSQVKNSATDTTSISSADLIIQAGAPPNSSPTRRTAEACYSGNCIEFNGSDNAVSITNTTVLDLDQGLASGMTFAGWIKVSSDGENSVGQIISKGATTYLRTTNEGADRYVDLEASLDLASSDATVSITNALPLNEWHFVAFGYTDDGDDEVSLYIDGQLRGTSTNGSGAPASDSNDWLLGGASDANFHGLLDEVRLYSYERTTAQVRQDYTAKGSAEGVNAQLGSSGVRQSLNQGLVAYYPMNEAAANTCSNGTNDSCDSSGNRNDAAWNNDTTTANGKFGNATSYDGTGDYATTSDSDSLDTTGNWSISGWVYNTNTDLNHAWQYLVMKGTGYGQQNIPYFVRLGYGQLSVGNINNYTEDSDAVSISSLTAVNTWMHFTAVFNDEANTMSIYVNGQLQTTASTTQSSLANSAGLGIAATANGTDAFKGSIDELRIYNRAVSADEAKALYSNTPGPIARWSLDENTGTSAKDDGSNALTATLTNGPTWNTGKFGSAVNFDGTDDYLTSGVTGLPTAAKPRSFGGWIKMTSDTAATKVPFAYGNCVTNGDAFGISIDSSEDLSFWGCGTANFSTSTTVTVGDWHHVMSTYDGSNVKVFLDGRQVGSTTAKSLNTGTVGLFAGSDGSLDASDYDFAGLVDDLQVFDYALTEREVQALIAGNSPNESTKAGPVLHLAFDDGSGTTAQDSTSYNNDGTLTNMAAPATSTSGWSNSGKFGKALAFDGSNDYVSIPNSASVQNMDTKTISAWIKISGVGDANAPRIIDKHQNGTGWHLQYKSDVNQRIEFYQNFSSNDGQWGTPVNTAVNGQWLHIVVVYDRTSVTNVPKMYINGILQQITLVQTPVGTASSDSSNVITIGDKTAGDRSFNGLIDEVKVYNYALSENEIKQECNRSSAITLGSTSTASNGTTPDSSAAREYCVPGDTTSCAAPVGEWKFDENTGTAANDTSGNNNTGTLTNSPTWAPGKLGSAVNLSPTSSYVSVPDATSLNITGDLTISTWVKPSIIDSTARLILGKGNTSAVTSRQYGMRLNATNQWQGFVYSGSNTYTTLDSTTTPSTSRWDHLTMVRDATAGTLKFYTNGILRGSASSVTGSLNSTANILALGREGSTASNYFGGTLDNVRIYNYARTPAQVAWEYNRGAPMAHYKFDECQGSTANNSALFGSDPAANAGTITIGASGTNTALGSCKGSSSDAWKNGAVGKFNNSLSFDGTDDYITVASPSNISAALANANRASFAFWFKPANTSQGAYLISGRNGGVDNKWWLTFFPANGTYNGISMRVNGSTSVNSPVGTTWSADTWYHIAGVFDGTNITLYRDGQVLATGSSSAVTSIDELIIGNVSGGGANPYNGLMDDVRIYNYGLTAAQVKDIYNGGAVNFR